MVHVNTDESI